MTRQVFTLGYSGRTPDEIRQIVEDHDAILFDIRFSPRSRVPQWTRKQLTALMGADRYQHIKALGNQNYKGDGPVELVDYQAGKAQIAAADRVVILMCACKHPQSCHRTVVAELLRADGFTVREVGETSARPAQPALF
jgi:uncharacterized protein (DUF488 family)